MYYRYLKHSKLFGTNFSDDLIKKLCFCVHEKTFAPEEIIIKYPLFLIHLEKMNCQINCTLFLQDK